MVFFLIACHKPGTNEDQSKAIVMNNCVVGGSKSYGEVYDIAVLIYFYSIFVIDRQDEVQDRDSGPVDGAERVAGEGGHELGLHCQED